MTFSACLLGVRWTKFQSYLSLEGPSEAQADRNGMESFELSSSINNNNNNNNNNNSAPLKYIMFAY